MEAVIDTSVYVASMIEDDVNHREARRLLESIETWITPIMVVHELTWFFRREIYAQTAKAVESIIHHARSRVVSHILDDVIYGLRDPRNYNDRVILHVSKRLETPLATFDNSLRKLALSEGVEVLCEC